MIPRTHHRITAIDKQDRGMRYDSETDIAERVTPVPEGDANTVSSRLVDQPRRDPWLYPPLADGEIMHAPVLDIDFPAALILSSTPGHFHLYLDKPVAWAQYEPLLRALADAGIIEEGYARASIDRGATYVRKPTCVKPTKTPNGEEAF